MLKVILSGGLGNQMFQVAFAFYLERLRNEKVLLNRRLLNSEIKGATKRIFELDLFKLDYPLEDNDVLVGKFRLLNFFIRKGLIPSYGFEDLKLHEARYFWGYWHDLKYVDSCNEKILSSFQLKSPSPKFENFMRRIKKDESVAIHVRRGDYITNRKAAQTHPVMSKEYYERALKTIRIYKPKIKIYLFSDDKKWTSANLEGELVDLKTSPAEELVLMSSCSHQIIANSSFSWWSAYLNTNPDKFVIYPLHWFIGKESPNIFKPEWIGL